MTEKPRLDRLIELAKQHRELQQFGQRRDGKVHNGMTACTHTVCQFLFLYWKNDLISLNKVNTLAGMDDNVRNADGEPRGMVPDEVQRFFRKTGIPMVLKFNRPFGQILAASDRGPVMYAMRYGSAPRRSDLPDLGFGFARPKRRGATQSGANKMRHAVMLLGYLDRMDADGKLNHRDVFRKDPNHGSGARPERPPFDIILGRQARREYEDYRDRLGNALYAAVPSRHAIDPF